MRTPHLIEYRRRGDAAERARAVVARDAANIRTSNAAAAGMIATRTRSAPIRLASARARRSRREPATSGRTVGDPSPATTSTTSTTWRDALAVRATWTITSIDRDSCARIAASGQLGAACITSVSSRRRASIGPLAWHVASDPSWPVFMACTSPVTSLPRTSPTTSRSGRSRSAVRTSSSREIGRMPSGVAGRASRRTTCVLVGCSSAVSSSTMMRSTGLREAEQRREQRRLAARRCAADDDVAPGAQHVGEQLDDPRRCERLEREGRAGGSAGSTRPRHRRRPDRRPRTPVTRRAAGRRRSGWCGRGAAPTAPAPVRAPLGSTRVAAVARRGAHRRARPTPRRRR